ncbi:MAG: rubredoxin [Clostridiales bacterium]|nr:rubredoxin [Clostridiales bacterium]
MKKYICPICSFTYDEAVGIEEENIKRETKWEDIPSEWVCPLCATNRVDFLEEKSDIKLNEQVSFSKEDEANTLRVLSIEEMSALCSNLSKGCEKQYRDEEANLFKQLSEYFKNKGDFTKDATFSDLSNFLQKDLDTNYKNAKNVITKSNDRGALRALVWGEKVTRILSSVINRYDKKKNELLENTNIYVCEICGFVYIGEKAPKICPVCKVPNMKIAQVKRR